MVGLRISILEGAIDGDSVYSEIHIEQTSSLGLVNLAIGKGTGVIGDFSSIDWGEHEYFIKVEIDTEGGTNFTELGTSQLLSVPYALYSKKSGSSYWTLEDDTLRYTGGHLSIGNPAENTRIKIKSLTHDELILYRNLSLPNCGASIIFNLNDAEHNEVTYGRISSGIKDNTPMSYDGYIAFQATTDGDTIPSPDLKQLMILSNGNIGLSTANPKSRLHVSGGDVYLDESSSGILLKSPDGQCWKITVTNDGELQTAAVICPEYDF